MNFSSMSVVNGSVRFVICYVCSGLCWVVCGGEVGWWDVSVLLCVVVFVIGVMFSVML